jgi:C4-dicarboxylate transporter DctM subunit
LLIVNVIAGTVCSWTSSHFDPGAPVPVAYALGIHPLHLGIIFIVNLEIGYLTPPVGINLFVASTLFRKGLGDIIRGVVPFISLMLVALLVVTYVPSIALGPVSLFHSGSVLVPFPEPHIPMDGLGTPEEMRLLSDLARSAEEQQEAQPTNRVLTLEEIMNQSIEDLEQEGVSELEYPTLGALLEDYRAVADGIVRIRDLAARREGTGQE